MKLLELFSGTGSVDMVARDLGYSVIPLDLKNASINTDILSWGYRKRHMKSSEWLTRSFSTLCNLGL